MLPKCQICHKKDAIALIIKERVKDKFIPKLGEVRQVLELEQYHICDKCLKTMKLQVIIYNNAYLTAKQYDKYIGL